MHTYIYIIYVQQAIMHVYIYIYIFIHMCVYLGEHPLGPGASGPGVHGADVSAGRRSAAAVACGDHAAGEGAGEINIRSLTKKQRDLWKKYCVLFPQYMG
jgi:hypothetical protein